MRGALDARELLNYGEAQWRGRADLALSDCIDSASSVVTGFLGWGWNENFLRVAGFRRGNGRGDGRAIEGETGK